MNFPCDKKSLCRDDSNPFQNLSAEAPDAFIFFGYASGPGSYLPRAGGNWNDNFNTGDGVIVCASTISQEDADLCADRIGDLGLPPDGPPTSPTNDPMFFNTVQTCTVFCTDGSPFTFQVAAGLFVANSQILADRAASSYACTLAARNKVCMGALNPNACLGTAYSSSIVVTGRAPFTFTITSGSLPPGLTLTTTSNRGTISGTPTTAGNFSFTIRVQNGAGNFMVKTYTISVMGFTNSAPTDGVVGSPYNFQLAAAGGTGVYTFTLSSGILPDGLTLSTSGLISGTPTTDETESVTFTVTDSAGQTCSKQYEITTATSASGFQICNWTDVLGVLGDPGCTASAFPAWNGIFNHQDQFSSGDKFYYFLSQSIFGERFAPDDGSPNYPAGDWQNTDSFTYLGYSTFFGAWLLVIICDDGVPTWFGMGDSTDPDDPTGTFTQLYSLSGNPATISIEPESSVCCPSFGNAVPVNFNPASPARVRVTNLPLFLSGISACPTCNPSAAIAWDGTLPIRCTSLPTQLNYGEAGWIPDGTCSAVSLVDFAALSFAGFTIHSGIAGDVNLHITCQFISGLRWAFQIRCIGAPGVVVWSGTKTVGDTPQGTYLRDSGCSPGPDCVTIEGY